MRTHCHKDGVPRPFYTRMLKPEDNSFMLAPLAKSAGGTEKCGQAVFKSKADPDYQKLIDVFKPLQEMLEKIPRADMEPDPVRYGESARRAKH